MRERDDKGRFLPGNKEGKTFSSDGVATEMQARSVEARKANRKERQTLAEVLRQQLQEKAADGSPMTRLEYLVAKAISNHAKGALSLKDLTYLQKLLGEDVQNINVRGVAPIVVKDAEDAEKMQSIVDNITRMKGGNAGE